MQIGVAATASLALLLLVDVDGFRKVQRRTEATAEVAEDSYPDEDPSPTRDQLSLVTEDDDGPGAQIVNGTQAQACTWTWQVGLYSPGTTRQFCGGSLISPTWVVTAQHCIAGQRSVDVMAGEIRVGRGTRRSSRRIVQHSVADFALIELSQPMPLGSCITAAPLPSSAVRDGTQCMITGWGALYNNGPSAQSLMEAPTAVVNNRECQRTMTGGRRVYDGDVCVLGRNNNGQPTSACNGDSGGPLVCRSGGSWTLYGATSWGHSCRGITVYAGTYSLRDWIRSTMR